MNVQDLVDQALKNRMSAADYRKWAETDQGKAWRRAPLPVYLSPLTRERIDALKKHRAELVVKLKSKQKPGDEYRSSEQFIRTWDGEHDLYVSRMDLQWASVPNNP